MDGVQLVRLSLEYGENQENVVVNTQTNTVDDLKFKAQMHFGVDRKIISLTKNGIPLPSSGSLKGLVEDNDIITVQIYVKGGY